jgi:hypothetical protein
MRMLACSILLASAPVLADEIRPSAAPSFSGPPPELALGAAQLALPPLEDVMHDDDARPVAAAVAYGQLVAGSTGVGLGGGAAAAIAGASCDLASGSVQGLLHTDDAAPVVGVARADLCLDLGVFVRYHGERAAGLAPAIDARRSLWNRPYDARYDRVEMGVGPLSFDGVNRYSIFHVAFGHGEIDQVDQGTSRRIVDLDLDLAMVTYEHGSTVRVDALAIANDAIKAGDSDLGAVTTELDPVRASVDTGGWFASARGGWGWAGGETTQSGSTMVDGKTTSSYSETVDSSGLPQFSTPVGAATVGGRSGRLTASATVSHDLYPTFDGNVAVESRASTTGALAFGKTMLAVSPFVARTRTWVRDGGEQRTLAAGAQLQVGRALPHELRVDALAVAGRTPYARLGGGREPDGALGGQVMVALSAHRHGAVPHVKL